MFTGIITDIGVIDAIEKRGDLRIRVRSSYDMDSVDLGASIACSGVCLTVVDKGDDETGGWFAVDVSAETVARTARDQWTEGRRLNLERALKVGDELGGHIVTGHVDGIGEIVSVNPEGDSKRIEIETDAKLAPSLAPKGSITVDGVSLTVNSVQDLPDGGVRFGINIIPHTAQMTSFNTLAAGRAVNLEIDLIARYLERMQSLRTGK